MFNKECELLLIRYCLNDNVIQELINGEEIENAELLVLSSNENFPNFGSTYKTSKFMKIGINSYDLLIEKIQL